MGINNGNAEGTTNAGAEAVASIQNVVSFAAMNSLMVPLVHPALIKNVDATQFVVGNAADETTAVKYLGKRSTEPLKVIRTNSSIASMGIKYYCLVSHNHAT